MSSEEISRGSDKDDQSKVSTDDQSKVSRRVLLAATTLGMAAMAAPADAQPAPPGAGLINPSAAPVRATEGGQFREALRRIASDTAYRNSAIQNPRIVLNDFRLSLQDLRALRDAAVLSGADVSQVDNLLNQSQVGPIPADACCCSCCCCGETGVDIVMDRV
jgi:hypothetical protein